MFKNKLFVFVLKRVLICFIVLSIIVMISIKQRWFAFAGIFSGGILSILRFGSSTAVFTRITAAVPGSAPVRHGAGVSVLVYVINQVILLPLIFVAYKLGQWFFSGFVAGILLVPFVVMLNSVTEILAITHNEFK